MTWLDDREKAYEAKYRLDQETAFKVTVRRNKLLGLWAAERLGLAGDKAKDYAKTVVTLAMNPGEHDVADKVLADFRQSGISADSSEISHKMAELMATAHEQVLAEIAIK